MGTSTRSTTQKTLSTSAAFSATSSQTAWLSKFWMVVTTSTSPARTTSEVIQLSPSATSRLPTLNPRTLNGWAVIQHMTATPTLPLSKLVSKRSTLGPTSTVYSLS